MNIGPWLVGTDARPHSPVTVTGDPRFESVLAGELGMIVNTDLTFSSPKELRAVEPPSSQPRGCLNSSIIRGCPDRLEILRRHVRVDRQTWMVTIAQNCSSLGLFPFTVRFSS